MNTAILDKFDRALADLGTEVKKLGEHADRMEKLAEDLSKEQCPHCLEMVDEVFEIHGYHKDYLGCAACDEKERWGKDFDPEC